MRSVLDHETPEEADEPEKVCDQNGRKDACRRGAGRPLG